MNGESERSWKGRGNDSDTQRIRVISTPQEYHNYRGKKKEFVCHKEVHIPVNDFRQPWKKRLTDLLPTKNLRIPKESPVDLSLRLDEIVFVEWCGVGYPPWNAFVAQLPPIKGMWYGLLDNMDGRVLRESFSHPNLWRFDSSSPLIIKKIFT
ncbi:hypothetical protein L6452_00612 [Arctium lappa]|uniref:Uncharacterized protein n=1 Tax=Arctium lappa TaxID=4217 RepID=A0ACB9FET8_ARCLA|nr:hypothetical protein L6452_00612 [Arctium lappa]